MPRLLLAVLVLLVLIASPALAADEIAPLLTALKSVGPQAAGSPAARAAWDKVVLRGPAILPQLLDAMDTTDTVAANWLRTAFDRIVDTEMQHNSKNIDTEGLLAFVKEAKHQGRVRRLALDVVERLRSGTTKQLVAGWLDDPEFRHEAVAVVLEEADALARAGDKEKAVAAGRKAFGAARDMVQTAAAARLKELGVTVSVLDHLGFLRDWHILGPFDARGMKGFAAVYPPEEKIDLAAEYMGKGEKKLRWQPYHVAEPPPASADVRGALVNFDQALGTTYDAVAYAATTFRVPEAQEVEFRGSADDNLSVWVNGRKAFGFEEYRNGVRLDRHRFKVRLQAGVNTVLVKVCQAPVDPTSREPNWEFLLRVVDATGKGIERQ